MSVTGSAHSRMAGRGAQMHTSFDVSGILKGFSGPGATQQQVERQPLLPFQAITGVRGVIDTPLGEQIVPSERVIPEW
jgi:hypothetical protein